MLTFFEAKKAYDFLISLPSDHPYWVKGSSFGITWTYLVEHGPKSEYYAKYETPEARYKAWYGDHLPILKLSHFFDYFTLGGGYVG